MHRIMRSVNETLMDLIKTVVMGLMGVVMLIAAGYWFWHGEKMCGVLAVLCAVQCYRD